MRLGYTIFIIKDHKSKRIPSLGKPILTLPLLLTYIYVTHLMTFTAKGAPHLQFVHSSILRVYIYV